MHPTLSFALSLAVLGFAVKSSQAETLYYNFESLSAGPQVAGTVVDNLAAGPDGTLQLPQGSFNIIEDEVFTTPLGGNTVSLGKVAQFVPNTDAEADGNNPNILTNGSVLSFGITGDSEYTAMAWVNFNSITGDNMIFGQTAGDALHLGSRNGNYMSGHWGDDVGPDQGFLSSTGVGEWHHVAYTNDGPSGVQTIYVDGDQLHTGAGGSFGGFNNNLAEFLRIGIARNNGSFNGMMDEVRVFDARLTEAQIEQYASGAIIPEPASALLGAVGVAGLLYRRRRPSR